MTFDDDDEEEEEEDFFITLIHSLRVRRQLMSSS